MRRVAIACVLSALLLGGASSAQGGGQVPVKAGRYAGGGNDFHVFFAVSDSRSIPNARVYSGFMEDCAGLTGPAAFDLSTIEPDGRFSLKDDSTFPGQVLKVTGRFVAADRVRGKFKWITSSDCPAGTYSFAYTADRFASLG